MTTTDRDSLQGIKRFDQLVKYLRDKLDWPIDDESFDDLTFDYEPEELGIDMKTAAKIQEIKQLRPLISSQPWGIFFVKFEPKRLPVVALRRLLSQLVIKRRASSRKAEQPAWHLNDLLFISNYGEGEQRQITFAHFAQDESKDDLPTLKVLGWDNLDTPLHIDHVAEILNERLTWPDDETDITRWRQSWGSAFTLRHREVIDKSKDLAVRLAVLARAIRDRIRTVLAIETKNGPITKLLKAFQEALIHDLDADGFADMYAQTIAYGLLSARIANPKANTADGFASQLPVTNPFLKELMETFLLVGGRKGRTGRSPGIDFDELGVSEVVELLDDANMEAVIRDFGDRNQQEDPVIHFYELFLKEYDAKKRMQRGAFYTPQPVVSYIIRSAHELLQTEFCLEDGLASTGTWGEMAREHPGITIPTGTSPDSPFVMVLDIATGTGTFLVEAIDVIHKTMMAKWQKQGKREQEINKLWNEYVPKHLLPRLYGYELMMAPYAIAHMKIGLKLFETGYKFASDERVRVYLTNTLEPPNDEQQKLVGIVPALAHEAEAVNAVKRSVKFTVVVGNPPYARISSNMGKWISDLIEDFKYVDGVHFAEVKHWLHDDYVKFLRLAYLILNSTGCGILGMITNRGYLSGPTFRGMRCFIWHNSSLLYLLDLHGGAIQEECKPPLGLEDENVFEIKQGVAIMLSSLGLRSDSQRVHTYAELWGDQNTKYDLLSKRNAKLDDVTKMTAVSPRYDFVPNTSVDLDREYSDYYAINALFSVGSTGIQTSRDAYVIDFDRFTLQNRVEEFCDIKLPDDFFRVHYGLEDGRNWNLRDARCKLRAIPERSSFIVRCQFRPFDNRWMIYHPSVINWPRPEVMPNMLRHNISLVIPRNYQGGHFDAALVSRFITEVKTGESTRGCYCFPLYLYKNKNDGLFTADNNNPLPNLNSGSLDRLSKNIKLKFIPRGSGDLKSNFGSEDILNYFYACLYSHSYRMRYSKLIKNDFPRVPLTPTLEIFRSLAKLGGELVAIHLLESPKVNDFITRFSGKGDNSIPKKPTWQNNAVWINSSQRFEGVSDEVWNFHIGGYQVCEKWLKDRKGRTLTEDDINHYQKIVVALSETIRLMGEIDDVIEKHGGWPGAFATDVQESP